MPIVWSEDAKKYLVPTRLEHVAGTARPKPAAMWKGARKEYTRAHAYWAKGPDQAPPATKKNLTAALELLASDTAPEALAYDEVLAAASFIAPTIVWWVLAREGLVRALRVVSKANELDRGHGRGAAWIVPAGLDSKLVFAPEAMRTWYLLADREEQDAARALAGKMWEHARPAVRAGLVLMIPEQHAWARELATTWRRPGRGPWRETSPTASSRRSTTSRSSRRS